MFHPPTVLPKIRQGQVCTEAFLGKIIQKSVYYMYILRQSLFYCGPVSTLFSRSASGTMAFIASCTVLVCAPTSTRSVLGQ